MEDFFFKRKDKFENEYIWLRDKNLGKDSRDLDYLRIGLF